MVNPMLALNRVEQSYPLILIADLEIKLIREIVPALELVTLD